MSRSSPSITSNSEQQSSVASASPYTHLADLVRSPSPYISPYGPISGSLPAANPDAIRRGSGSPALSIGGYRTEELLFASRHPQTLGINPPNMNLDRPLTYSEKSVLVQSLQTHRVNTLIELRRIEKVLNPEVSPDVQEALAQAWAHYVYSNNLLSELRSLTKNYPFSSECLDEAKWMALNDSQKSWNFCWLVLRKAKNQNLIPKHARLLAARPAMWGGRTPTSQGIEQVKSLMSIHVQANNAWKLAIACEDHWSQALNQMLRHWDNPPTF